MILTFVFESGGGQTETLELGDSLDFEQVRQFIHGFFGIEPNLQVFVKDGNRLRGAGTLTENGLKSGDCIFVMNSSSTAGAGASSAGRQGGRAVAGAVAPSAPSTGGKVYWEGMSWDEVLQNNSNPEHIVDIIQSNEKILRELNFHNPKLAESMRKDRSQALGELRTLMMMNATSAALSRLSKAQKEKEMEQRLRVNPMDEEANKYFGEKIRQEQVEESYVNMMNNFPEAMTRVLMLYVEVKINGVALQAFVDSGAQTSVISGRCAEKCNVTRLIDSRFAGQVVGVGTGKTLGRVHLVDIVCEGNHFPISMTVMDDSQGLGDTKMEFLLGLDFLKRHRATLDLDQGKLVFKLPGGQSASTPFLHEKDLPESKGGTKDFNPNLVTQDDDQDVAGDADMKKS